MLADMATENSCGALAYTKGACKNLAFAQAGHDSSQRSDLHFFAVEYCPNRFAIKSCLFGCFPQSTRADLRD